MPQAAPVDPLWGWFSQTAGADQQIDAEELQRGLSALHMADYPRPGASLISSTTMSQAALLTLPCTVQVVSLTWRPAD